MTQELGLPPDVETLLAFVTNGSPLRVRTHAREEVSVVEKGATLQTIAALQREMCARRDWKTPLAIGVTVAVVVPLTDWSWSGTRMGISAEWWMRLFELASIVALVWAIFLGVRNRTHRALTSQDIYERIAGNTLTDLSRPIRDSEDAPRANAAPLGSLGARH